MSVSVGDTITLDCVARGTSPVEIMWYKDGVPVFTERSQGSKGRNASFSSASSRRYKLSPSGALQVFNIRPEDVGAYMCVATLQGTQGAGKDEAVAYLSLSGNCICGSHCALGWAIHDLAILESNSVLVKQAGGLLASQ